MSPPDALVELPTDDSLWQRCFTLAPLVVVGTREPDGGHDLAPKHMATPLGWGGWFGFVCTPAHRTWDNAVRTGVFTVSFLRPDRILDATFSASPRETDGAKPGLDAVPTIAARQVDGVLVEGCDLYLECELDRVVGGLGDNGLLIGRIVAAHAHPEAVRDPETDDAELLLRRPLLAYVAPDRFAVVDHTQRLPLHLGFKR